VRHSDRIPGRRQHEGMPIVELAQCGQYVGRIEFEFAG
jgi:hypothetical protein